MITDKTLRKIISYSTPFILDNLASLDFLANNVQKVDGKTPFYDNETETGLRPYARKGKMPAVRNRSKIHLKDSWQLRFTVGGGIAKVKLLNTKRSSDGKWNISDLLWYGTRDYEINVPDIVLPVPIFYKPQVFSTIPGVGRTQAEAIKNLRKYRGRDVIMQTIKGHQTGAMTFYNRYTGHMNYARESRRGIRSELVTSFKDYILLCVKDGIRKGAAEMYDKNLIRNKIINVSVRVGGK